MANNGKEKEKVIELKNVSKRYGDFTAVRDVTFSISKGEIVGMVGHNGAGKTTILRMITGYLEPSEGEVRVGGYNIVEERLLAQRKLGYLPENCPLYSEMTVIEYLQYMGRLRGVAEEELDKKIKTAIDKTSLWEKAKAYISTLSRGYKQRVGVAQAIMHNPEIVILDEPTNGLDPSQIREMRGLIKELSNNATVLVSTHILPEVEAVCERVIMVLAGGIALDKPISEFEDKSLETVFREITESAIKEAG
ncbi:MAG: ABC transporter ATP-binding protein [Candidatus Dadabacteria bacterium]|nr:MAG: ABC transporter ATP-binding protein [Candidatus Dadabacteria bacterium]